jgi:short-subunit dehydrogenase
MATVSTVPNSRLKMRYGPWAVVTGASDGIGKAFADELAREGFSLLLIARRRDVLESLAEKYRANYGIMCEVLACDLARPEAMSQIEAATEGRDAGLLVAAAGFGSSGEFLSNSVEDELLMVDVNCRAVMALAHKFGQRFANRGQGGIVLLSSLLAFQGVPGAANYAATKAYIQSLGEGLGREMAPKGVDVLSVAPGPINSGFARRANLTYSMSQSPMVVAQQALKALGKKGTVRPGYLAKALEVSLSMLPRRGRVRIMQQVMGGMANAKK